MHIVDAPVVLIEGQTEHVVRLERKFWIFSCVMCFQCAFVKVRIGEMAYGGIHPVLCVQRIQVWFAILTNESVLDSREERSIQSALFAGLKYV